MLRQDSSSIDPDSGFNANTGASQNGVPPREASRAIVDIQRELVRLQDIIYDSPHVPIWGRIVVDENLLTDQLEFVYSSLPDAFREAEAIVHHKEEILLQAEQYAQELVETAERRAAQIMNESGIVRQAEMQAQQIRQRVQQECESIREQTIAEIDRMRRQAQQELEEMQRMAIAECEEIQAGADDYADRTLQEMEGQLAEMLRIIRNGRQQLQPEAPLSRRDMPGASGLRSPMRGGK